MDVLMLEGWTPILLIGLVVAIIVFIMSRRISREALVLFSSVLSLICIGIIIYSREGVGGWEGLGLLFVTLSSFLGIWVGTISGLVIRKK